MLLWQRDTHCRACRWSAVYMFLGSLKFIFSLSLHPAKAVFLTGKATRKTTPSSSSTESPPPSDITNSMPTPTQCQFLLIYKGDNCPRAVDRPCELQSVLSLPPVRCPCSSGNAWCGCFKFSLFLSVCPEHPDSCSLSIKIWGLGRTVCLINCLPQKHEGLSLILRTQEKMPGMVMSPCNPNAGKWGRRIPRCIAVRLFLLI